MAVSKRKLIEDISITTARYAPHAFKTLNQMTERKKQVKVSALIKMETFLNSVYLKIGKGDVFSLDALARENKLSGSVATLMKRMYIVEKIGTNNWQWAWPAAPERSLAITLLDEVNRHNGNWKDKSPMLTKALKQDDASRDLFSSAKGHSDLIYLAGCIAMGAYSYTAVTNQEALGIEAINERITFVANDLLTKINNLKN